MKKYIIIYIIDNKSMPTTQIKPFGVFNGSKTTGQSTNYASSSFGCVPQQPTSVSTPLPMKGFGSGGGAAMLRPM
jgi:hypothetical protein